METNFKKKLVVELDIVKGDISFINDDEMTYIEIMGALEYVKMLVYRDWMDIQ